MHTRMHTHTHIHTHTHTYTHTHTHTQTEPTLLSVNSHVLTHTFMWYFILFEWLRQLSGWSVMSPHTHELTHTLCTHTHSHSHSTWAVNNNNAVRSQFLSLSLGTWQPFSMMTHWLYVTLCECCPKETASVCVSVWVQFLKDCQTRLEEINKKRQRRGFHHRHMDLWCATSA